MRQVLLAAGSLIVDFFFIAYGCLELWIIQRVIRSFPEAFEHADGYWWIRYHEQKIAGDGKRPEGKFIFYPPLCRISYNTVSKIATNLGLSKKAWQVENLTAYTGQSPAIASKPSWTSIVKKSASSCFVVSSRAKLDTRMQIARCEPLRQLRPAPYANVPFSHHRKSAKYEYNMPAQIHSSLISSPSLLL